MYKTPDRTIGFKPQALERYLKQHLPDLIGRLDMERVPGNHSNPTFFLEFDDHDLVLRKQPPGKLLPNTHAIDREYQILKALAGSEVPVPEVLFYCDDPGIIGTPFYVMERLDGRIFTNSALPGVSREDRSAMYDSMNETLAGIHRLDWQALGLSEIGKQGYYFSRQINRWSRQWQSCRTRSAPAMEELIQWLNDHIPPESCTCLIHGDFHLRNLLFHPSEPQVIAVLDWEQATLGHPLADIAFNCIPYHTTTEEYQGVLNLDRVNLGIPSEADYLSCYYQRSQHPEQLTPFHHAFALFRLAVIQESMAARTITGNGSNDGADEHWRLGDCLVQRALELLKII